MKAIVYRKYGSPDVLALQDVEKPAPMEGEVLIQIRAASVNPLDWHFLTGKPLLVRMFSGLLAPNQPILGADIAGTVEAVGTGGTSLRQGDEVFGTTGNSGSFAEYASIRAANVTRKPSNLSAEEAAAAPWPRSPPCRGSATRDGFGRVRGS